MVSVTLTDANIVLYDDFFDQHSSECLFQELLENIDWQQDTIRLFGKSFLVPRLSAWYGDPGTRYTYSGLTLEPLPWLVPLTTIRTQLDDVLGINFNSVLLNLYRDGNDGMGWHSDDEPELGPNPVIASLSLGAVRNFKLRHKTKTDKLSLDLKSGSLLLMQGTTQTYWQHSVAKTKKPVEPRINLTFRVIKH